MKHRRYRLGGIWDGKADSKVGIALASCSDDGPAVMFVTNVHTDEAGNTWASGRVFSGKIKKTDKLHLIEAFSEVEVKAAYVDMGALREEVAEVSAGNLVTLTLGGKVGAGETLVDLAHKDGMLPFESIVYVSEPVVTLAIEPKKSQDMEQLQKGLDKLTAEDPNLKATVDKETGEYLLSGMGELHLEVAA